MGHETPNGNEMLEIKEISQGKKKLAVLWKGMDSVYERRGELLVSYQTGIAQFLLVSLRSQASY